MKPEKQLQVELARLASRTRLARRLKGVALVGLVLMMLTMVLSSTFSKSLTSPVQFLMIAFGLCALFSYFVYRFSSKVGADSNALAGQIESDY